MKRKTLLSTVGFLAMLVPLSAYALSSLSDQYDEWIVWTPGEGQKPSVLCDNNPNVSTSGYYAFAIENNDEGSRTVDNFMQCGRVAEWFPGKDTRQVGCVDVPVTWTPGAGIKPWAQCTDGKYATGFAIYDYGGRNEGINRMRCCSLKSASSHSSSTTKAVLWNAGKGPKGFTTCPNGYMITGVQLKDYTENNQAVYQVRCTTPSFN